MVYIDTIHYSVRKDGVLRKFAAYVILGLTMEANRQRSVFPGSTALPKALYLAIFEVTKKWTMPVRNRGQIYGELSVM